MKIQNRYEVKSIFDDNELLYYMWDLWEKKRVLMSRKQYAWLDANNFFYTHDKKFVESTARFLNAEIKRYTYAILEYANQ